MERIAWLETVQPADAADVAALLARASPVAWAAADPWALAVAVRVQAPGTRIIDVHGCEAEADRVLCLGRALGCVPPGEPAGIAEALGRTRPAAVVCVGDTLPGPAEQERLAGLAPEARWIHLSWPPEAPTDLDPADPARAALSALPRGLPGTVRLEAGATRPTDPGRAALLRPAAGAEPPPLAAVLVAELLHGPLRLAEDAPLPDGTTVADLFALRWLAAHHPQPDTAARAGAAAARVQLAWGQPAAAQAVLRAATLRSATASASARARLDQAEGDVLAHLGEDEAAAAAHERAAARLRGAADIALLLRFTRRRAEGLLARGRPAAAQPHLRTARALSRELADPLASAAALRASGDAAAAAGERLGAEALYDQAAATPVPSGERTNRLLGEIGLALRRGEFEQAGALLARLPPDASGLARAGALHRAAEHALHTGDLVRAPRAAAQAADAFARSGAVEGQARATRLLGDTHAAAGRRHEALRCYADALELQIRVRDLAGARRTLAHGARVAEDGGLQEVADRLRALGDGA
jgi:tetratricopeptide (TPR) repeat protein